MAEAQGRTTLSVLADLASIVTALALVAFLAVVVVGVAGASRSIARAGTPAAAGVAAGRRVAPPPVSPVAGLETSPSLATVRPQSARVALVEFTDFQCPYCGIYARNVYPRVKTEFVDTGKIAYVERSFPVETIHPFAVGASRAAECAREHGKFWDLRTRLFNNQNALEEHQLVTHAAAVGLGSDDLHRCMSDDRVARVVEDDRTEGRRLGVTGTPTFFIGTMAADNRIILQRKIVGAQSFETFKTTIDQALAAPSSLP